MKIRISAREACVRPHFHTRSEIKIIFWYSDFILVPCRASSLTIKMTFGILISYFARYWQLLITSHSAVGCKVSRVANLDFSVMFLHESAHLANCEIILQISKIFKFCKLGLLCVSSRIGAFGNFWDYFANF